MKYNPDLPVPDVDTRVVLWTVGLTLFIVIGGVGLFFAGGIAYQLRALARQSDPPDQTHGLVFPASAVVTSHDVDPDVVRLDGGATTQFDLPAPDLPAFLAQLNIRHTATAPLTYPAHAPRWVHTRYTCTSATGDFLYVDVGDPTQPTVRVQVYTDWN